jgi:hypothetical protein
LRLDLFTHLKANNKGKDEFLLFNKTQKILDRFIFVCFCEDAGILPSYTLKKTKEILINAFDFEEHKLWRQLKGLFHSMDKGNPPHNINRFNGGLFAKDEDMDNLIIPDDVLLKLTDIYNYGNPKSKGFEKYGFDVIIGNPPYVVLSSFKDKEFEYFQDKYKTSFGRLKNYSIEQIIEPGDGIFEDATVPAIFFLVGK